MTDINQNTPANMQIAETLTRIDLSTIMAGPGEPRHPKHWRHETGRPLTVEEIDAVMNAGIAEWQASKAIFQLRVAAAESSASAAERFAEFTKPYFDSGLETVGDIKDHIFASGDAGAYAEFLTLLADVIAIEEA